jgi:hypothetical protein
MADKPMTADTNAPLADAGAPTAPVAPRRPPGHRSTDVRDTVAEMAARAQEISQEAGSKVAAAMKDVIGAAAGLAGFAIESARDLVQYMVRRGQMTQEEADKLMREAEEAYSKRPKPPAPRVADVPKVAARATEPAHVAHSAHAPHATHAAHASHAPLAKKAAPAKKIAKPAAKPAAKSASKSSSKSRSKSVKAAPKKASKPASAASRSKLKAAAKKRK